MSPTTQTVRSVVKCTRSEMYGISHIPDFLNLSIQYTEYPNLPLVHGELRLWMGSEAEDFMRQNPV